MKCQIVKGCKCHKYLLWKFRIVVDVWPFLQAETSFFVPSTSEKRSFRPHAKIVQFIQKFHFPFKYSKPGRDKLFKNQIEIARIEVLNAHETVFTASRVASAVGMECQAVDWSEMSFKSGEFLFVDEMEEARIEFAWSCWGGRDIHGILTAAEHDVIKYGADGRGVHRSFCLVGLQALQSVSVEEFCCGVLWGWHKHRSVSWHWHILNLCCVILDWIDLFAGLK